MDRARSWLTALVLLVALAAGCAGGTTGAGPSAAPTTATSVVSREVAGSQPVGDLAFLGPARQVPVNGIQIGYRQFGDGPPLVLIVGQDSTMSYWGPDVLRALAAHFRVTIFDNRGVGLSTDRPDQPLTIETMSDDTAGLIDALGLDHPTVFGWSTGGEIGLALVVRHPDQVGHLMVSGATPGGPETVPPSPDLEAALASTDLAQQAKLLDALFTPSGAAGRQRYVQGLLAMPDEPVSPDIVRRQEEAETAFAGDTAVVDGLASVSVPVLVSNGADDQLVPPENARRIAAHLPGSTLVVVPDAAHAWMVQDIDRFVAMLVSFSGAG